MVQSDELGREQAWAAILPEGFPISAVAAERMAFTLCVPTVQEAQEAEVEETSVDREAIKASWARMLTFHADCVAAIHATSRAGTSRRGQFKYGGR